MPYTYIETFYLVNSFVFLSSIQFGKTNVFFMEEFATIIQLALLGAIFPLFNFFISVMSSRWAFEFNVESIL